MQYHYKQKSPTNNIKTQFRKQSHVFCGLSSRLIQMLLRFKKYYQVFLVVKAHFLTSSKIRKKNEKSINGLE